MIPQDLLNQIEYRFSQIGRKVTIKMAGPVGGGCIHHATKLTTSEGPFFLKWNSNPLPGMFSSEAHGLAQIKSSGTIRTPDVLFFSDPSQNSSPCFILMEWIEHEDHRFPDPALLGEKLAELHLTFSPNR